MLLDDKIFVRSSKYRPNPFRVFCKHTLEEVQIKTINSSNKDGQSRSLKWAKFKSDSGRQLTQSMLITDGQYIYVLA